jgi:hypothetical protein
MVGLKINCSGTMKGNFFGEFLPKIYIIFLKNSEKFVLNEVLKEGVIKYFLNLLRSQI